MKKTQTNNNELQQGKHARRTHQLRNTPVIGYTDNEESSHIIYMDY
jgi:hypothetical protein